MMAVEVITTNLGLKRRTGAASCVQEGTAAPGQEEQEQEVQLFEWERQQLQSGQPRDDRPGRGDHFQPGVQSPKSVRTVPRCTGGIGVDPNAPLVAAGVGGRRCTGGIASGCSPIFQAAPRQTHSGTRTPRTTYVVDDNRPAVERQGCFGNRLLGATPQVDRKQSEWHSLECLSTPRSPSLGAGDADWDGRVGSSTKRCSGGDPGAVPLIVPGRQEDQRRLWEEQERRKRRSKQRKGTAEEGHKGTRKRRATEEGWLEDEDDEKSGASAPVVALSAEFSKDGSNEESATLLGTVAPPDSSGHGANSLSSAEWYSSAMVRGSSGSHAPSFASEKVFAPDRMVGKNLVDCGGFLLHRLLEVLPLRSKPRVRTEKVAIFPLPTSRSVLMEFAPTLCESELTWLLCVCLSLNSLWGEQLHHDGAPVGAQAACLEHLIRHVRSFSSMSVQVEAFDWRDFFQVKSIDYKGDEVRVARWFCWGNIEPALPRDVGTVDLSEVCSYGCKAFVENIDEYLRPAGEWGTIKCPRVMVEDDQWDEVCQGLVTRGLCDFIELDDIFVVHGQPLLNGLFGVTKDEFGADGTEIYRLIMNLIPFNQISYPVSGDVQTLPALSMMTPFFLQPSECLLVSSEDVKCFFYTMKVLPMGYLNSVSIAQHVHRNLVIASRGQDPTVNQPGSEVRKDKAFTVANPQWRVYLDNYDLLEKVEQTNLVNLEGTTSPAVLALRNQYEVLDIPRNTKKSVQRAALAEMQGATVNGTEGIAYPRESKIAKYFTMALHLVDSHRATQKQWQVVSGGLVYMTMFRRPLLGSLNRVWTHVESYNTAGPHSRLSPPDCRLEVTRVLGLLPLARMDFRLPMHPQVTCSDASTSGGGICCSMSTTSLGAAVATGTLRGEDPSCPDEPGVVCIGLFDGIGALRVALEVLGVPVLGYVSVEKEASAQRVVASHFPGVLHYPDITQLQLSDVQHWARQFSQCCLVIIGAGPPCQGVSGLNADRRGALKDARSSLFSYVGTVRTWVKQTFTWCPSYTLMESVASMDDCDRDTMTASYGEAPFLCDAACATWCHRPRLYWIDWELVADAFTLLEQKDSGVVQVQFAAEQPLAEVVRTGWHKVDLTNPFPTFTTARPSAVPGRKPAGIKHCTLSELQRWSDDLHRFPPYQYKQQHCVQNRRGDLRIVDIAERESMMGFPVNYTQHCSPKSKRTSQECMDIRLTLIGNSWSVPVVSFLLQQFMSRLGLIRALSPQEVMDRFSPLSSGSLQGKLFRLPLNPLPRQAQDASPELANKLGNLISVKGEDVMLTTPQDQLFKFHRIRATVPARLWKWRVIAGWKWRSRSEHINALEMRSILTTLRWRIEHQHLVGVLFLHLTDSLVCLHSLSRGRSSSRKLRRILSRINSLILVSGCHPFWGYVQSEQNPADAPSRWGRRVRTKFRHA
eukprot:Skav227732  [mRNA]  locus=scaffold3513:12968:18204:+ [translate_table: standard]